MRVSFLILVYLYLLNSSAECNIIFFNSVLLKKMNALTIKKQNTLISDSFNTTPTHTNNISFQQYKDSVKLKKPSYMISSKHPRLNQTKLNESLFLSTHNTLRER
jgi:hypothetical protein